MKPLATTLALLQDLKRGNLLNATEDAVRLHDTNAQYKQRMETIARQKEAEAQAARAAAAQASAVMDATAPATGQHAA